MFKFERVYGLFGALVYLHASTSTSASELAAGELAYQQCIGCHSFEYNRTGPKHCGVFGRQAGSVKDYDYSEAMRESDIVWNEQTLSDFLESPLSMIPGTSMGFVGISNKAQRQDLIAYIRNQSNSAQCQSKPI